MATPPYNLDITNPTDTSVVAQFPANERTFRDNANSYLNVEHDINTGFHKFQELTTTAKTALVNPPTGMFVWDTTLGFLQLNTGTPAAPVWTSPNLNPPGTVIESGAILAPQGYLACDGSAVSRFTQSSLFNAITIQGTCANVSGANTLTSVVFTSPSGVGIGNVGAGMPISAAGIPAGTTVTAASGTTITLSANTTAAVSSFVVGPYGIGDGTSTFNVPDKRGQVGIGVGVRTGLTTRVLGVGVGAETSSVVLTQSNLPNINFTVTDPGHSHTTNVTTNLSSTGTFAEGTGVAGSLSTGNATTGITVASGGSGTAITPSTVQPSIGMNYYIKT